MAYEFVRESEAKQYRSDCSYVLKETCELLKKKGISAQFSLVGSGARNMITRDGNGPYDLDYNLLVMKADDEYRDPRLLKDTIRNALNKAVGGKFFSDAQDSTSCLTALLHFKDSPTMTSCRCFSMRTRWRRCWACPSPAPMSSCTRRASPRCGSAAASWYPKKSSAGG